VKKLKEVTSRELILESQNPGVFFNPEIPGFFGIKCAVNTEFIFYVLLNVHA